MEKVKVISEKYNDEDVLHMDGQDLADAYLNLVKEGKIPEGLKILKREGSDLTAPDTELLMTGEYAVLINGILFIPDQVDTSDESLLMYKFVMDEENSILTYRTCWFCPSEDIEIQTYGMTLVNDLYWKSFETKSVVANPTLAGTESRLEGLQVGNTKYQIKPLYYHPITIWNKNEAGRCLSCSIVVINDSAIPFSSLSDFFQWCKTNNISYLAPCSGYITSSDGTLKMIIAWVDVLTESLGFRGHYISDTPSEYLRKFEVLSSTFENYNFAEVPNRIN